MSKASTQKKLTLGEHLERVAKIDEKLRHLLLSVAQSTNHISYAIQTSEGGLAGGTNESGEEQLKLDVLSNQIIADHLRDSGVVRSFSSEEQENLVELSSDAPFSVVFDPLDGSSLVEANFAIGSIFGFYKAKNEGFAGRTAREQIAALYVVYGPRTTLVYSAGDGVHEFLLNDMGEFILVRANIGVGDNAKNFSPGNLRALEDNPGYAATMQDWLKRALTLRYSGCMVADVHHIFAKGQGVFTNVGGNKYPEGKLRLLYECGPFAYLMEQAGGAASNGKSAILDSKITDLHQRSPLVIGSQNEVERVCEFLKKG
jgi:fructose-1,6-bisphosphatase I